MDETLISRQEVRHPEDRCAVAVIKLWDGNKHLIVGHVPKEISRTCLQNDSEIACKITGFRRQSPVQQACLEVPCSYKYVGKTRVSFRGGGGGGHLPPLANCLPPLESGSLFFKELGLYSK